MAQKTIICLRGKENTGKTTSIRECYKLMTGKEPKTKDFIANVEASLNIKIGFSSWGAPGANKRVLQIVLPDNCDVVITACRTHGGTVEAVDELAKVFGYQVIYIYLMNGEDKVHQPIYTKMNVDAICEIIASLKLQNIPNAASCKGGNFKILYEREY